VQRAFQSCAPTNRVENIGARSLDSLCFLSPQANTSAWQQRLLATIKQIVTVSLTQEYKARALLSVVGLGCKPNKACCCTLPKGTNFQPLLLGGFPSNNAPNVDISKIYPEQVLAYEISGYSPSGKDPIGLRTHCRLIRAQLPIHAICWVCMK